MTQEEIERRISEISHLDQNDLIIWSGMLDGRYYVAYINESLHIWDEDGSHLYESSSPAEYPTLAEPDISDIERWVTEATTFIDSRGD